MRPFPIVEVLPFSRPAVLDDPQLLGGSLAATPPSGMQSYFWRHIDIKLRLTTLNHARSAFFLPRAEAGRAGEPVG